MAKCLAIPQPEKKDMRPIKIFVASPADVTELRKLIQEIVNELNAPGLARHGNLLFHLFVWETSKAPEFTNDYQRGIFDEFGEWCDIFILLLWHNLGSGGTEKEYEYFRSTFSRINPDVKFWSCWYVKPVSPAVIEPYGFVRLREFIKQNEDQWAPLGGTRGAVTSKQIFERILRQEFNAFLNDDKMRTSSSPAYQLLKTLGQV